MKSCRALHAHRLAAPRGGGDVCGSGASAQAPTARRRRFRPSPRCRCRRRRTPSRVCSPPAGRSMRPTPDIVMTLRAGVAGQPVLLRLRRLQARPRPRGALRLRALSRRLRVRLVAHRRLPHRLGRPGLVPLHRRARRRDDEIEGLDDVRWSAEAGLGVGYEQRNWRAFADVRYGFVGHNTWVGELGADAIAYPIEGLTLTAGPRLSSSGPTPSRRPTSGSRRSESTASGLDDLRRRGGCSAPGSRSGRATSSTSAGASRARSATIGW